MTKIMHVTVNLEFNTLLAREAFHAVQSKEI